MSLSYRFVPEAEVDFVDSANLKISTPWLSAIISIAGLDSCGGEHIPSKIISSVAKDLFNLPFVLASTESSMDKWLEQATAHYRATPVELCQVEFSESEKINPLCAYSHLRHYIFSSLTPDISDEPYTPNLDLLLHCLQQAWYITSHSVTALSAGLAGSKQSRFTQALSDYIKDEDGHHHFIEKSLCALGCKPNEEAVSPYTVQAIKLLTDAAKTNSFALTCCITYFEMGGLMESDPIANCLREMGYEEAAKPIESHFRINREHEHAFYPLVLINTLDHLSKNDVRQAFQITRSIALALRSAFLAGFK